MVAERSCVSNLTPAVLVVCAPGSALLHIVTQHVFAARHRQLTNPPAAALLSGRMELSSRCWPAVE
jgi:hypothetical protein